METRNKLQTAQAADAYKQARNAVRVANIFVTLNDLQKNRRYAQKMAFYFASKGNKQKYIFCKAVLDKYNKMIKEHLKNLDK